MSELINMDNVKRDLLTYKKKEAELSNTLNFIAKLSGLLY